MLDFLALMPDSPKTVNETKRTKRNMQTLNPTQQSAVTSTAKTILCIAGPGSGKTRTLVERIKRLVLDGADPTRMVVVTFTNAAAKELAERLPGIAPGYCGTLHGFALRILRRHGEGLGFTDRVTVLDEQQADDLLQEVVARLNYRGSQADLTEAVKVIGTKAQPTDSKAVLVARTFHAECRRNNLVTFDSLLYYGGQLGCHMTGFDCLFADEFQDSSDADLVIYDVLPIANKFFVGDPDQSIYAFRGGNVDNIMAMAYCVDTEVHKLELNYRSDERITSAAQRLIEHNTGRVGKATLSMTGLHGLARASEYATAIEEQMGVTRCLAELVPTETAILCRTNAAVQRWTEWLKANGVPVATAERSDLPADWRTARALLAALNDTDNDRAVLMFLTAANAPTAGLLTAAQAKGVTVNSLTTGFRPDLTVGSIGALVGSWVSVQSAALIMAAIDKLHPDEPISALQVFLSETQDTAKPAGNGVTVATLHGAKGREWDVVFLPGFEQATIPGVRKDLDIEEERRLAYVGMTRARHELHVSWCRTRPALWDNRQPVAQEASQFVGEAGL